MSSKPKSLPPPLAESVPKEVFKTKVRAWAWSHGRSSSA